MKDERDLDEMISDHGDMEGVLDELLRIRDDGWPYADDDDDETTENFIHRDQWRIRK